MSERGLPPYPTSNDWKAWATQLVDFLSNQARSEEFVAPRTVALSHQIPGEMYRAVDDGLLMFDPSSGQPVYSYGGVWLPLGGTDSTMVGMIGMFPIDSLPSNWLTLDGSTYDALVYPDLFTYLGTTTLPDLSDQFVKASGTDGDPGDTGGEKTVVLTEGQMPNHTHPISTSSPTAQFTGRRRTSNGSFFGSGTNTSVSGVSASSARVANAGQSGAVDRVTITMSHNHVATATGNDEAHNNKPQHYTVVMAIRAA